MYLQVKQLIKQNGAHNMRYTLRDMLEQLDIFVDSDNEALDTSIEIHQQMNYPLKSSLINVRMLDGKLTFACGTASQYGSKDAWEPEY